MEPSGTNPPSVTTPDPALISDEFLVTFDRPVTLFDQLRLAEQLRQLFGRPVDLMTDLHPAFEEAIIPTLVPLPL